MSVPIVNQLRITCLSGPWLDDECVRFIELSAQANLYDLHVAIQDAVDFDEEFPFYYFTALTPESGRSLIPAELPRDLDLAELDPDVYEDCCVWDYAKPNVKENIFYAFGSEFGEWVFKVQNTGDSHEAVKGEFYPLVLNELSIGPDPEQYGSGFDDFAESEEEFRPGACPVSDAEYNPDDEQGQGDCFFGCRDEDEADEGNDYASDGAGDDDDDVW